MTYDTRRGRVVLFGGRNFPLWVLADTWEWDGTTWRAHVVQAGPPWCVDHALAFDEQRGRVLLCGGHGGPYASGQGSFSWTWDGASWAPADVVEAPAFVQSAVATDDARGRVVLFGGADPWQSSTCGPIPPQTDATLEWDGATWERRRPAVAPPPRDTHAMAFDRRRGRTVLFGGRGVGGNALGDTWEWDGATWTPRPGGQAPAARHGHALAFDASRGEVLLFGGQGFRDTWVLDANGWSRRQPSQSPAGSGAMACDEARGEVVLFDGGGTWVWDGSDWTQRPTVSRPPAGLAAMAWDRARQRIVLRVTSWPLDETWEWDGVDWLRTQVRPFDGYVTGPDLAWDPASATVLLAGTGHASANGFVPTGETLVYRPTVHASVASYGAGCAGTAGVPQLAAARPPLLGDPRFALRVTNARPGAPLTVGLAAAPAHVPLPGSCVLLVAAPVLLPPRAATAAGEVLMPLPIAADAALRGGFVRGQAMVLDPSGAFAATLAFSAGLELRIGD